MSAPEIVSGLPARTNVGRQQFREHATNTYGCLDPIEIAPLEALLDDVKRTQAHIMWLEHYIAQMDATQVFTDVEYQNDTERERARMGKPTVVGSVRWQMEMQRQRATQSTRTRNVAHPAVKLLLEERRHLTEVSTKAIAVGVKLDSIDYSRQQAELIISAMNNFALSSGLNPNDPTIAQRMVTSLDEILQHAENAK
jgi:hypothetical protein